MDSGRRVSAAEGAAREGADPIERPAAALDMRAVELKDVMHALPDFEPDRHAGLRGGAPGVVDETRVRTDLQ
ncbi:hypothetical protein GCM10007884_47970 [Methylobacterium brachythecii]|uniref:Uncharacterized protein n=1 Tax=Methylobacterium brachythecii TaxID=1176177 RepID=A0ABQ6DAZ9_9HYPH|nr:hypothetical protein GCM10007884_47970 [Methylobacterium brachythecii]